MLDLFVSLYQADTDRILAAKQGQTLQERYEYAGAWYRAYEAFQRALSGEMQ